LHADAPAHETDDGDDRRLPQQRGGLGAVRCTQPRGAVRDQSRHRRLQSGDSADGGRQQPRPERAQHGHGEHREADFTGERAQGEGDSAAVRTSPPLDGGRADRDEQRPVQDEPLGTTALQERHDHRHDHRGAAHEDSRYRRFRGAFGGDHREVEADHADSGEQG